MSTFGWISLGLACLLILDGGFVLLNLNLVRRWFKNLMPEGQGDSLPIKTIAAIELAAGLVSLAIIFLTSR